MTQYIDKDAVVAEIERLKNLLLWGSCSSQLSMECNCKNEAYNEIISYLNTLDVKEVDLDSYYHEFLEKEWFNNSHVRTVSEMMAFTAKHFFELGLKAQKGE